MQSEISRRIRELSNGAQSEKIGKEDERKEAQEEIPRDVGIGNEEYAQGGSEDRALKA